MFGPTAAYVVAIAAMLFAVLSALTLFTAVKHIDPPEAPPKAAQSPSAEDLAA